MKDTYTYSDWTGVTTGKYEKTAIEMLQQQEFKERHARIVFEIVDELEGVY